MIRYLLLNCFCLLTFSSFTQSYNQIILRYWNGTTDGKGVTHPVGLQVSATTISVFPLVPENVASLSGEAPKYYFKKKFVLFFTVKNVSSADVAIYDWAFKAVCPVDNMGRKFDASSMVPLVTPYIPGDIYIVLKPGEKKQFYSGETDFYWCLPQDKDHLLLDPQYFQALITCASITGTATVAKLGQKAGAYKPPSTPPRTPGNELDPQLTKMINEHNILIHKNENEQAEMLKERIFKITNIVYPSQVNLVESKLIKAQLLATDAEGPSSPTEKGTLSFNGRNMEAEGDCIESTATLTAGDESMLLVLNNLGTSESFSVNSNFYTNGCTSCLAIQLQDLTNSKTYIAVSGSVNRTAKGISIDVTMKELLSVVEGGGQSFRVTGKIICE